MNSETTYDTNAKAFLKKWNVRFSVHFVDNSCPPFAWRFKSSEHYAFCTNPNDARLIAAAPDLLEACKVALHAADDCLPITDGENVDGHYYREKLNAIFNAADALRFAIAKATTQKEGAK